MKTRLGNAMYEEGYISADTALQHLREREGDYQRRRRVCQCLDYKPLRQYRGVWQCMLCLRPREAP